jgi:hypothetical protein
MEAFAFAAAFCGFVIADLGHELLRVVAPEDRWLQMRELLM